jgi:hypothetical protein
MPNKMDSHTVISLIPPLIRLEKLSILCINMSWEIKSLKSILHCQSQKDRNQKEMNHKLNRRIISQKSK